MKNTIKRLDYYLVMQKIIAEKQSQKEVSWLDACLPIAKEEVEDEKYQPTLKELVEIEKIGI